MGISVIVIKEKNKPEDWRSKLRSEMTKSKKYLFESEKAAGTEKECELLKKSIDYLLAAFSIASDHINWED